MGEKAASVLLKMFISGKEICYTTDSIFKCKLHSIHNPREPENYDVYVCMVGMQNHVLNHLKLIFPPPHSVCNKLCCCGVTGQKGPPLVAGHQ